jgi:two-component system, NtrC family, response regulator HydG
VTVKSNRPRNILIVDDDRDVLYTAYLALKRLFAITDTIDDPELIPEYLKKIKYDIILLDMNYKRGETSGEEGLKWLKKILQADQDIKVLITTAYGEIDLAVQAIKMGAVDFIIKPWDQERLLSSIHNALSDNKVSKSETAGKTSGENSFNQSGIQYPEIIFQSDIMARITEIIKTVAPTCANVLIMGENGTGKELAARALHNESQRKDKPFVHVDLGAIPETLFEAELFGHTKGAFTDAREERAGRFEAASGGTLFLDEIGNLGMQLQAKILTAIQNKRVIRIGSNQQVPVDVRIISATNMPLEQLTDSLKFRQDLLYRINTVEITLPPLRERIKDIKPIAGYYLKLFSEQYNKPGLELGEDTQLALNSYDWPGNIRELAHSIERAVILSRNQCLSPDDFSFRTRSPQKQKSEETAMSVEDYERNAILNALKRYDGNLSKASEELGIARSTLYRKIAYFGLDNFS